MPDIDSQKIELNLIPKKGEQPVVFYASQYETARPFIAVLKWGDSEFAPGVDCHAEIDIRKNDDNLVVITDDVSIDNNEVSVILPVQAVTCIGKNLGQVKIYSSDDHLIAALNFILEVQPDPLAGGVTSETAIDNIESQIAAIVPEVIGDDYYNKTETDALLAAKANTADLATVATTGDYDDLINKPVIPTQVQADYTQADTTAVDYIKNKPDINAMIAAAIDDILPTVTVGPAAIANFNTSLERKLVSCTVDPLATIITCCAVNLWDEQWDNCYWDESNQGVKVSSVQSFGCNSYIPVPKGGNIYFSAPNAVPNWFILFYDENKSFISFVRSAGNEVKSVPNNACYMTFYAYNSSYGTTYNNDISINYPSTDTQYHAYNGQTYPVADKDDITTLNGVNNIFADAGDITVTYKDTIQHYIDNQ